MLKYMIHGMCRRFIMRVRPGVRITNVPATPGCGLRRQGVVVCGLAIGMVVALTGRCVAADEVDFSREVLPLFQRACFECHGPQKQKAKLRLDQRESVFNTEGVVIKGNAAESELYRRIMLPKGHDQVMPSRGEPLAKDETDRIKSWIEGGAVWPDGAKLARHWAYVAPVRPAEARIDKGEYRIANAIDGYISAKLEQKGLHQSSKADPATLIRRLSLDLTGLPPTPDEVDAFVKACESQRQAVLRAPDAGADQRDAYEQLVDRLLASKQFGVRWARPWLDYARYADSHGFQRDDLRDLWAYRDWVVDALNADMPYTQFTIEQLAGDLLPDATASQKVATGFNRSAPTNVEAGSDPEETRVNQVHDRVSTLGMIWLGTTLECAQCHDHKYDAFTQRDYYGLFAFFNNTAIEADRTNPKVPGSIQFRGPTMELIDPAMNHDRTGIEQTLAQLNGELADLKKKAAIADDEWESSLRSKLEQLSKEHVLEIADFDSTGGATHEILSDQSVLISGEPAPDKDTYTVTIQTKLTSIRAIKLEALAHDSLPGKGPGRGDETRPNFVLNNLIVTAAPPGAPDKAKAVKFTAARASFSQANYSVENLLKASNNARGGWAVSPRFHESHWALLETDHPLGFEGGTQLTVKLEQFNGGGRTIGRLRLTALTGNIKAQPLPADVAKAIQVPANRRSAAQRDIIASHRLIQLPRFAEIEEQIAAAQAQLRKHKPPTTLVMQENHPRTTSMFQRGDFRAPGDKIEPHTPAVLHALNASSPAQPTRLDLARWLVNRDNPLAARVTVNRWWAELFGHGLVTTPEDFGIKGDAPTHPQLLDWLACEFMDNGWSMKKTLKTIVMSETYQQSSKVSSQLLAKDDLNLLYARGPRFRMEAEMIRDNALAIAGLLNLKQGGPSIQPYQPDGLWVKVGGQRYDYVVSPGAEQHRRGLYVVLKRGSPYPSFVNFDANSRMACRVKRPRSNTPLQALTLMNDPVFVDAAKALARRILTDLPDKNTQQRIEHAFRLATSRQPRPQELAVLAKLYEDELEARAADGAAAKAFVGEDGLPPGISARQFAAWYAIATTLLNLDETITKG